MSKPSSRLARPKGPLDPQRAREPALVENRNRAYVATDKCAMRLRAIAKSNRDDLVLRNITKIVDAVASIAFMSTRTVHPSAPKEHIEYFTEDVMTDNEILSSLSKARNWAKAHVEPHENEYDTHQGIEALAFTVTYNLDPEKKSRKDDSSLAQWLLRCLMTYFDHLPKIRTASKLAKGRNRARAVSSILEAIEVELVRIASRGSLVVEDAPLVAERMLIVAGMPASKAHQVTTFLRKKRKRVLGND